MLHRAAYLFCSKRKMRSEGTRWAMQRCRIDVCVRKWVLRCFERFSSSLSLPFQRTVSHELHHWHDTTRWRRTQNNSLFPDFFFRFNFSLSAEHVFIDSFLFALVNIRFLSPPYANCATFSWISSVRFHCVEIVRIYLRHSMIFITLNPIRLRFE